MNIEAKKEVPIEHQTLPKTRTSTLIEFPGKKRQEIPQWRKELQEKFRSIQEKRAREAELENSFSQETDGQLLPKEEPEGIKLQLEVVPSASVNPIVAAALARIEKAHNKPIPSMPRTRMGRAAVALADLPVEEEKEQTKEQAFAKEQKLILVAPQTTPVVQPPVVEPQKITDSPKTENKANNLNQTPVVATTKPVISQPVIPPSQKPAQAVTATKPLLKEIEERPKVVPSQPLNKPVNQQTIILAKSVIKEPLVTTGMLETKQDELMKALDNVLVPSSKSTKPQVEFKTVDMIEEEVVSAGFIEQEQEANQVYLVEDYDDYAPFMARAVSFVFDFMVVIFATSPFAAILELGGVDWSNNNVLMAIIAIVSIVSFVYLMASVSMLGRTWGMAILSLRVADDTDGYSPTFLQSCKRAIIFMLSVCALGLPFLYALFDAEGRALHDKITGTIVIRES